MAQGDVFYVAPSKLTGYDATLFPHQSILQTPTHLLHKFTVNWRCCQKVTTGFVLHKRRPAGAGCMMESQVCCPCNGKDCTDERQNKPDHASEISIAHVSINPGAGDLCL